MWQRPSFDVLMEILQSLELSPPIWNHRRRGSEVVREQQETLNAQRKGEVTRYLSSIISSPLAWIDDEDQQEQLWTCASKRMSERCGRTAMGEVTRSWPFVSDGVAYESFGLIIKEPALTGDSLGFKTWGSSYVLSQHLPVLGSTSLFKLFDESLGQPRPDVLELGSGTGLLGLAAAALWKVPVWLSDLPNIVPNLEENAEKNTALIEARGGSLKVGALTWGGKGEDEVDPELFGERFKFKVRRVSSDISLRSFSSEREKLGFGYDLLYFTYQEAIDCPCSGPAVRRRASRTPCFCHCAEPRPGCRCACRSHGSPARRHDKAAPGRFQKGDAGTRHAAVLHRGGRTCGSR